MNALVAYLEEAWGWVDEIPPLQQVRKGREGGKEMRRREQIHARESRCLLLLVNKFTHLTVTPSLPPSLPPSSQPMRFGNKAFRDWHARLLATAAAAVEGVLVASGVREMREMREGGRKGGKEGGREGRREGVAGHLVLRKAWGTGKKGRREGGRSI